jgi:hypothetical protein
MKSTFFFIIKINCIHPHFVKQDCLIFGRKDAKVQELVTAVVVLKQNMLQVIRVQRLDA